MNGENTGIGYLNPWPFYDNISVVFYVKAVICVSRSAEVRDLPEKGDLFMSKIQFTHFNPLDYATQEAINTLCTNLTFSGADKKKIMITSCQSHEGKSMLSMNIMRTMSKLGKTVVLIDGDLRRSQIISKYGVRGPEKIIGMSHYLAGQATLNDIVYETDIPNAYFVPAGHLVSNSLALLSAKLFPQLLDELAAAADYVIVDAPPVGMIIDAAEIAKHCDGTVIACQYNAVDRKALASVKLQIEQTGCEILGVVLNQVSFDTTASKRYYYKSYYYKYDQKYYRADRKHAESAAEDK
ncbi:MAG: hypothetical protein CW338_04795 [Clostridiales bacterium]|nr:hypothetical protein [Clostridiales bacterium]